jgi:hypothetical protein
MHSIPSPTRVVRLYSHHPAVQNSGFDIDEIELILCHFFDRMRRQIICCLADGVPDSV